MSNAHRVRFAVCQLATREWSWRATRAGHQIASGAAHTRRAKATEAVEKLIEAIEQKQYVVVHPDDRVMEEE